VYGTTEYAGKKVETVVSYPAAVAGSPSLIFVHGGNYNSANRYPPEIPADDKECKKFQALGYAVFAINYPLLHGTEGDQATAYPIQVEALERAVKWVEEHAAASNGSTTNINIIGGSTGAAISLIGAQYINQKAGSRRVKRVIGLSGMTNAPAIVILEKEPSANKVLRGDVSIALAVTATEIEEGTEAAPSEARKLAQQWSAVQAILNTNGTQPYHCSTAVAPTFWVGSGETEAICPVVQQEELHTACVAEGYTCTLKPWPGSGHSVLGLAKTVEGKTIYEWIDKFLRE
jgi:acetyl esterase/lipase